jgi:uncharacterized membrane protein YhhN
MAVIWISIGAVVSGLLTVWFAYRQPDPGYYLFKPLTTSLILVLVFLGPGDISLYDGLIGAGLVFSILGDILLMLPSDRFLAGLGAFLITHLLYISAFSAGLSELFWEPALPILGLALLAILLLDRKLKEKRLPVYLYIAVISAMAWTAWSRWMGAPGTGSLLAACGAALFLFSDLILALNRFKSGFKSAQAGNLLSYYLAQLLIALSAVFIR